MSALWNASVAAGPYVLCILLAAVAIYGLAWVMDNMPAAGLDPYAEAFGDVGEVPAAAKERRGGAAQGSSRVHNGDGSHSNHGKHL
jgi:hypothetical protein